MSSMVKVGTANQGWTNMSVDSMVDWEPKKIAYMGTTVFFQIEDTFHSMERKDYEEIFGNRFK